MAGRHNQLTNRPTLVVDDKIIDVADGSIAGLNGGRSQPACLQMKIVACTLTCHKMRRWWSLGKIPHAPIPTPSQYA